MNLSARVTKGHLFLTFFPFGGYGKKREFCGVFVPYDKTGLVYAYQQLNPLYTAKIYL